MKIGKKFHFYTLEKSLYMYVAWACFRNVINGPHLLRLTKVLKFWIEKYELGHKKTCFSHTCIYAKTKAHN